MPAVFRFDFLAEPALLRLKLCFVYEFYTACFTGAVLIVALVGKIGPIPVATRESFLVVKAHSLRMRQHSNGFSF